MSGTLASARRRLTAAVILLALLIAATWVALPRLVTPAGAAAGDPVLVAAGDIARIPSQLQPTSGNMLVADLIESLEPAPDTVVTLGDNQYNGELADYMAPNAFHASWGRFRDRIRPTIGDEDAITAGDFSGYYAYFNNGQANGAAGPTGRGYYSFNVGQWHVVVLNSTSRDNVSSTSEQAEWLRADLAANPRACTLATIHDPLFTSNARETFTKPLVEILYEHGVDIMLSGDVHHYERFAKQDPDGNRDAKGIRAFVVGTGGHSTGGMDPAEPNSEARGDKYGVLKLTLKPTGYDWDFLPAPGDIENQILDEPGGSDTCVGDAPPPPAAPVVSSVGPAALAPGGTGTVVVRGANFSAVSTVDFGAGVTITGVQYVSPQQLNVTVRVAATAAAGTRTVTVRTGDATGSCAGCFSVTARGAALSGAGGGYWFVASDGGVFNYGAAAFHGSTGDIALAQPIVGMARTADGKGYWMVARDGGIFAFGDAEFFGSTGDIRLVQPIVGMAPTPSGNGYWLVSADGGIFAFGDATFFGSTGDIRLVKPIVGMAATPSGNGYWLTASDGGIFAFGDAAFHGSTGAIALVQPIVAMAATPSGNGYWLTASDGGVFSFGDARFFGSTGDIRLAKPIVAMAATPTGNGYWFVASDGGIFNYGDAAFLGSAGGNSLARPVVAMAATP